MKKWMINGLLGLIFVVGAGIFFYPIISNQWNKLHQSQAIASYNKNVEKLSETDYNQLWNLAREYNKSITKNTFSGDAFTSKEEHSENAKYHSVLNVRGNGIMGYVSIPKIKQKIPIYHGTSEAVLQIAAGHMEGTKLPIGGEGNHSVIAAHRGLPSAKLFSDLDRMKIGDKFYIHVLNEILAYQVDDILPMVEKEDYTKLLEAMSIQEGEDQVTLFTCTPYGINSHRMLVRGKRVPYNGEEEVATTPLKSMVQTVNDYYMLLALLIISIVVLVGMVLRILLRRKSKRS